MSEDCERIGEFVAAVHAAGPGSALGLLGPGSTVRACLKDRDGGIPFAQSRPPALTHRRWL